MAEKRRRRLGDRKEGRYLRSLDPYYSLTPYIMKDRNDSTNYFKDSIEVTEIDRFLRKERAAGHPGLGMLHLFVAAYVRTVSQRPAINRFISGRRIYARNDIEFVMTVKKEMKSDAGETSIKIIFDPKDTLYDVYEKMNREIDKVKNAEEETSTDDVAAKIMKLPRFLLRLAIAFINMLDYFGKCPQVLLNASPFHGSMIITDLGSLGVPAIYHHIYNFGNLPIFLAYGAKRRENVIEKDGSVVEKKYIDYKVSVDERICDGFYMATALKYMKSYMRRPEQLLEPPEQVFEDIDG